MKLNAAKAPGWVRGVAAAKFDLPASASSVTTSSVLSELLRM